MAACRGQLELGEHGLRGHPLCDRRGDRLGEVLLGPFGIPEEHGARAPPSGKFDQGRRPDLAGNHFGVHIINQRPGRGQQFIRLGRVSLEKAEPGRCDQRRESPGRGGNGQAKQAGRPGATLTQKPADGPVVTQIREQFESLVRVVGFERDQRRLQLGPVVA